MKKEMPSQAKEKYTVLLPVLVLVLIALVMQLIYMRRQSGFSELKPRGGVLDVRGLDFTDTVYTIANDWDFYPRQLYDHEDFAGKVESPRQIPADSIPYGTHRLVIKGNPGQYLTVCGYSVDYGSRLYVDGQLLFSSGTVSESPETSVPKTGYLTVPICLGADGEAELICQYVNFVHEDGGYIHTTYVSTPQNIEEYKVGNNVVSATLGGGLLVLSLYFLLLGAVQRQKSYLCLALCCLLFSMRDQLYFFLALLPRSLPWSLEYRIYLAVINLLPVSLLLMLASLYPPKSKWVLRSFFLGEGIALLLLALLPTRGLVRVNVFSYVFCIPYALYEIYCIVRQYSGKENRRDWLSLWGFAILLVSLTLEGILSAHVASVVRHGLSPTAMLIFIFLIALSISLRVQEQKAALAESRSRSQMLEQMNQMNLDFLRKVAHELKTPLTVISGYAQLTGMQIAGNQISEEAPENLRTIQTEAQRLANLVTTLMEYSCGQQRELRFTQVPIQELMERAAAVCRPLCLKNQNRLAVNCEAEGTVWGSGELLLQIFINLVINGNRHTRDGTITLEAREGEEPQFAVFGVRDTGTGIDTPQLAHIFEKGFSTDGGNGLGLFICREAAEIQGGTIWVEFSGPEGTLFRFTVRRKECSP